MRRLAGMLSKMDEDALKQRKEYDQVRFITTVTIECLRGTCAQRVLIEEAATPLSVPWCLCGGT